MKLMNLALLIAAVSLSIVPTKSFADTKLPEGGVADIWSNIAFVQGADICRFEDAYNKTRDEFVSSMVTKAQTLMNSNMKGFEAIQALITFNNMYDQIQRSAVADNNFPVTLEANLKAFLDRYYRDIHPRVKRLNFLNTNVSQTPIDNSKVSAILANLDFVAYGTYAFAPGCRGDLQVTLHLIGKDGREESFEAIGPIATVMSQIASELFTAFQRTQFPSEIKIGKNKLTIVGGLNGYVDKATSLKNAELACSTLDARLPNATELELINTYGDWSGGVSLGHSVWALPGGKVYAPDLGSQYSSPIRNPNEVNDSQYNYICVQ